MRYGISYNRALNIEGFISKIDEHTRLFNDYFGSDWAYSGSCAVILYAEEYLQDENELQKLNPPNDIDILVESRQPINNRMIGNYDTKIQSTLEKSVTYENRMNKNSIDVTVVPKLKKDMLGTNPVLDLATLLDYYEDDLIMREKDTPKIAILHQIRDIKNASEAQTTNASGAEEPEAQTTNAESIFGNIKTKLFE